MKPTLIKGNRHVDHRGTIRYNNDFNLSAVKRVYTIENVDTQFLRAWQGHKIEQRWFSAVSGTFIINLKEVDDWENPAKNLTDLEFTLNAETLDILHVPPGFITSIRSAEENSKLLVFADYLLNEVKDEYRFPSDYFTE